MKLKLLLFISVLSSTLYTAQVKTGIWRGALQLNRDKKLELPFNFEIRKTKTGTTLIIYNAQERINIDEVVVTKDSLNFKMPVFDTEFKTQIIGDSILTDIWIN